MGNINQLNFTQVKTKLPGIGYVTLLLHVHCAV